MLFCTAGVVAGARQLGSSSTEGCCGLCRILMEGSTVGGAQGSTQHFPMPSAGAGGTAGAIVAALPALVLKVFQCGVVWGGSLASRAQPLYFVAGKSA